MAKARGPTCRIVGPFFISRKVFVIINDINVNTT